MDKGFWPLFWCAFAFLLSYAFVLVPSETYIKKYALFHDQLISLHDYLYFVGERIRWIIYSFLNFYYISQVIPRIRVHLLISSSLTVFYFLDFLLFFNEPLVKVNGEIILNAHIFGVGYSGDFQKLSGVGVSGALFVGVSLIFVAFSTLFYDTD